MSNQGSQYRYFKVVKDNRDIFVVKFSSSQDKIADMTKMIDNLTDRGYLLKEITENEHSNFDYTKVSRSDISQFMSGSEYFKDGGRTFNDKELLAKYNRGESIGFTGVAHLKAKGLIKRADGTKRKSPKYKKYDNGGDTSQKFYRAVIKYKGDKNKFKPKGYYEAFDEKGNPMTRGGTDVFVKSNIPELSASKIIGGSVLGLWSMLNHNGLNSSGLKAYIYEITDAPDKDLSHIRMADFEYLQEVRYNKPVVGRYVGYFLYTDDFNKKAINFYERLYDDDPYSEAQYDIEMWDDFERFISTMNKSNIKYTNGGEIKITNEYRKFDVDIFNEDEGEEELYGFLVKDGDKEIGIVRIEQDVLDKGVGYILGIEVFEMGKGYGKKIMEKIFHLHPTQHTFAGKATSTSRGFWLKLGAEFEDDYYFILKKEKTKFDNGGINNDKNDIEYNEGNEILSKLKEYITSIPNIDDEPLRNWANHKVGDRIYAENEFYLPESQATPDVFGIYELKVIPIAKTDHYINGIAHNRDFFKEDDYDGWQTENLNKIKKTFDTNERKPIIAYEGEDGLYSIIDGHHRIVIANELGRKSILALVLKTSKSSWQTTLDKISKKYSKNINNKQKNWIDGLISKKSSTQVFSNDIQYNNGGNVLLAPNGKPSNLAPEQYKLVRTPEFKAWFGDWEKNAKIQYAGFGYRVYKKGKNSSLAIDENGEPKVFYHQTPVGNYKKLIKSGIINFDLEYAGGKSDKFLPIGFYLKPNSEDIFKTKKHYVQVPFFLNFRSVETFDDRKEILEYYKRVSEYRQIELTDKIKITDYFKSEGIDCIRIRKDFDAWESNFTETFLVLDNKNIKLADGTNTTFDGGNPDIRFMSGGNVLLAPNGKPSNLTPEQYKLVRTKAFKDWFGDWEKAYKLAITQNKDAKYTLIKGNILWGWNQNGEIIYLNHPAYKNVSKVLDDNGEPLIVYHGTKSNFNVFNLGNVNKQEWENVKDSQFRSGADPTAFVGSHFSKEYAVAREFAIETKYKKIKGSIGVEAIEKEVGEIKKCFLNIKSIFGYDNLERPIDEYEWQQDMQTQYLKDIKKYISSIDLENDLFVDNYREFITAYKENYEFRQQTHTLIMSIGDYNSIRLAEKLGLMYRELLSKKYDGIYNYENKKYDGIVYANYYEGGTSYCVWDATKIKLADGTNTTFDGNNPDIRFMSGGNVLLAPNGKPSNLTAEQYKLVRTKAFKDWFGDWENSPETASKVVDENGEPRVVYHGTPDKSYMVDKRYPFVIFDNHQGIFKITTPSNKAYYFSFDKELSLFFTGDTEESYDRIFSVFLNVRKFANKFNEAIPFDEIDEINKTIRNKKYCDGIYLHQNIGDGIMDADQIVVFNPNQIKLADGTNKTFYWSNPDIRFTNGGNVLLAPNGKPSNLAPEQYKLVRTPEFKRWFGDWENDTQNSSKILDENGEPLICFHGSNDKFDTFEYKYVGSAHDRGYYGYGFYFTFQAESKWMKFAINEAEYYGKYVKPYFIRAINPFIFNELSMYKGVKISYLGTESLVFLSNIAQKYPNLAEIITIAKKTYNRATNEYDISYVPISILPELIKKYANDLQTYETERRQYNEKVIGGYLKSKTKEVFYDYTESGGKKGSYIDFDSLGDVARGLSKEEIEILLIDKAIEKYDGIEADYHPEGYMTRYPEITDEIKKNHDCIMTNKTGDELVVFDNKNIKIADGTNTTFNSNSENSTLKYGGKIMKAPKYKSGGQADNYDKETYVKWKDLVNMSSTELKRFMDSEEGKEAGLSKKQADKLGIHYGRESASWILKMKETNVKDWTQNMWDWAKRQISFISRMRGNKGKLYDESGNKTRKHTSLLIWGHNPEKYADGGNVTFIEDMNLISIELAEKMINRKINLWNDGMIVINGVSYKKKYLSPFYEKI